MKSDSQLITEVHADIQWVKEFIKSFPDQCDKKYASKNTEWIQKVMVVGVVGWVITALLNMLQTAQAAINVIF